MDRAELVTSFTLNGRTVSVHAEPGTRLTRALRDLLGLTGTKVGCDAGDCGACTVLLDGAPVCGCLVAVGQVAGQSIETIEGLSAGSPVTARLQDSLSSYRYPQTHKRDRQAAGCRSSASGLGRQLDGQ